MATPIRYGLGTDHTKGLNGYSYKIWTGDRSHQGQITPKVSMATRAKLKNNCSSSSSCSNN